MATTPPFFPASRRPVARVAPRYLAGLFVSLRRAPIGRPKGERGKKVHGAIAQCPLVNYMASSLSRLGRKKVFGALTAPISGPQDQGRQPREGPSSTLISGVESGTAYPVAVQTACLARGSGYGQASGVLSATPLGTGNTSTEWAPHQQNGVCR